MLAAQLRHGEDRGEVRQDGQGLAVLVSVQPAGGLYNRRGGASRREIGGLFLLDGLEFFDLRCGVDAQAVDSDWVGRVHVERAPYRFKIMASYVLAAACRPLVPQ